MTTVVYRDGTMAADRQATAGYEVVGTVRKVHRFRGLLVGFAGRLIDIDLLRPWAKGWFTDEPPFLPKDADVQGLAVFPNGTVFHFASPDLRFEEVRAPFYAIGSGSMYAKGALAMGATAVEAVKAAAKFDVHTGRGVITVKL